MEIKKIHKIGLCGLPIRVYETDFILPNSKIEKIKKEAKQDTRSVSYAHLPLPTLYSV